MSNIFYLIVPSTAGVENKTNKFRVQLPKKIYFDGPGWTCGLSGIIYPNSWATIGTNENQYITVYFKDGEVRHLKIPRGSFNTPKHLEQSLYHNVIRELETRLKEANFSLKSIIKKSDEVEREKREEAPRYPQSWRSRDITRREELGPGEQTKEKEKKNKEINEKNIITPTSIIRNEEKVGQNIFLMERNEWVYVQSLEEYLRRYKNEIKATSPNLNEHINQHFDQFLEIFEAIEKSEKLEFSRESAEKLISAAKNVRFIFNEDLSRFELLITDQAISHVCLTNQIAYVLGFEEKIDIQNGQIAKYTPDLRGSISQICVYLNSGLIESIIFGNTFSNILQIIAVRGSTGEIIQEQFQNPLMHKIIAKEVDSLDIEIRSIDGRLINFDYGSIVLTLVFKRAIYF